MKILKPGKIKPMPAKWWIGHICECPRCKATLQIEEKDMVIGSAESSFVRLGCDVKGCVGMIELNREEVVAQALSRAEASSKQFIDNQVEHQDA